MSLSHLFRFLRFSASAVAALLCLGMVGAPPALAQVNEPGHVLQVDFDTMAVGKANKGNLKPHWPGLSWFSAGTRASITQDPDEAFGRVLTMAYPKGGFGPGQTGGQGLIRIIPRDEYWLSYWVKFHEGFDFRAGGKLPGLTSGGSKFTGGNRPTKGEGWSARYMWRTDGKAVLYLYCVDMAGKWGQDIHLGDKSFKPGTWHHLVQYIRINDADKKNGLIHVWLDGEKVLSKTDLRLRIGNRGQIDSLYFSTFHGGGSKDWAPRQDSVASFDKFIISTEALTGFSISR